MNKKDLCVLVISAFLGISNVNYAQAANSNNAIAPNNSEQISSQVSEDNSSDDKKIKANKETLEKAQAAYDNKEFQEAITLATIYISNKPKKYEAYKLRGDAFYALHQFQLAQNDYQTAVDIKAADDKLMTGTKYVSAVILGADKYEQLQNTELGNLYGRLMYAQKAQNDPKYEESYQNAVKYNSHIYLPQPKKSEINKINCPQKYGKVLNPQGIDAVIYGAIDDIEKEDFHSSIFKIQEITSKYPKYYFGHYLAGVALTGLEKTDDAIKSFNQALKYNPYDFETLASLGQLYFDKAETNFSYDDAQKSIKYFEQALKVNNNNNIYRFYIGMNELQMGNTNLAISNFNEALKINPNDYNSTYYKSIAQFINGDYKNVVDSTTKLLYKHVSNYNSVLYLRALANFEQNLYEKAISDLDTIQSNIDDIYNSDVKVVSDKEKTLESYIYYLRDKIARAQGTSTDRANIAEAYKNPIVAKLANAEEAMEPYEKILNESTVSLSDYEKFNDFYSTSLPKMLEENIEITSKDIDNQYDYIRTTFKDLGISFKYLNPDYKITTIENFPYKKYSSKLAKEDAASISTKISENAKKETAQKVVPELKSTTTNVEKLGNTSQLSVAQMLATNSLTNKISTPEKVHAVQKTSTAEITETQSKFVPQTPAAENVPPTSNIAAGDMYVQTGKPSLLNEANKNNVQNILKEEKEIQKPIMPENNKSMTQGVKLTANEIKETPDIVVKHTPIVIPATSGTKKVENNTNSISQTATGYKLTANEIKETPNLIVKNAQAPIQKSVQEVKNVENNIVSAIQQPTNGYKLTANEVKETPDIKIKYENPVDKSGLPDITKQTQYNLESTGKNIENIEQKTVQKIEQAPNKIEQSVKEVQEPVTAKVEQTVKEVKEIQKPIETKVEQTKEAVKQSTQKTEQEINNLSRMIEEKQNNIHTEVKEKYAKIDPEDFGVSMSKAPIITPEDEIIELDTRSLLDDMGLDTNFIERTKQNTQNGMSAFASSFASAKSKSPLTKPVVLEEEDDYIAVTNNKQEPVAVPVISVPKLEAPKVEQKVEEKISTVKQEVQTIENTSNVPTREQINSLVDEETAALIPASLLEDRPVVTDADIEKKAEEELNRIVPKVVTQPYTPAVIEKPVVTIAKDEPLTREKLEAEKARLQQEIEAQKEQLRLAKEKAKNEAKAQKVLEKEKAKAQKAQEKWEKNMEKAMAKNQEIAQKTKKLEEEEQVRLQKEHEKLISAAQTEKELAEQEILKIKQQTEKIKTKAEEDALKAQIKAERKQAQMEAKARKAAAKASEEKKSVFGNFFAKFKK